MEINIAVILTCHDRKAKTIACINHLYIARNAFNRKSTQKINTTFFITDDGCSDGTPEIIKQTWPKESINILQGTGNLYWAKGMILAWKEALKQNTFQYYLLLNDDTNVMENVFQELLAIPSIGIISGITCSAISYKTTYGGNIWCNKFFAKTRRLDPNGKIQRCDMVNANILLIPIDVIKSIGIFSDIYTHGCADYDYSITASKANLPVYVTASYCGYCENDHLSPLDKEKKITNMNLEKRKAYFSHPLHSNKDYLTFIKRNTPLRYPVVYIGRVFNIYFPHTYYWLNNIRKTK